MSSLATSVRETLTELVRKPGPWASVYIDLSGDRADPAGLAQSRRRSVRDTLERAGAPASMVEAVEEALAQPLGMPSPLTRAVLARADGVEFVDVVPGTPLREVVHYGPVPLLAPLLRQRKLDMCYLVVQAGREGGDIALYRTGSHAAELTAAVQGRTDSLPKVQAGGWSHLKYQQHSEEIWRQNEAQLANAVDALVLEHRPRLVVVSGDVRARQLLIDSMAPATKELVEELPVHTRAEGADPASLEHFVESRVDAICASDLTARLDRLNQDLGRPGGSAAKGVGWMAHALRQAQVDTLFVDPDALGERTLLALDEAPWVATAPEDASPAGIVAQVPAAEALIRAAVLTDADIRIVECTLLPDCEAAALLRWAPDVQATG